MNRIEELRKKAGLNQTELGKILHLSQKAISRYESGSAEPDLSTIKKIATFFNVTIDYLLGEKEEDIILITREDLSILKESADKINKIVSKISTGNNVHVGSNSNVQIGNNITYNKGGK